MIRKVHIPYLPIGKSRHLLNPRDIRLNTGGVLGRYDVKF